MRTWAIIVVALLVVFVALFAYRLLAGAPVTKGEIIRRFEGSFPSLADSSREVSFKYDAHGLPDGWWRVRRIASYQVEGLATTRSDTDEIDVYINRQRDAAMRIPNAISQ